MQFSKVCVILAIVLVAQQAEAQFLGRFGVGALGIRARFGPLGLGLGPLGFGGLGFGGLGFGGLGFGGVPVAVPVPVPVATPVAAPVAGAPVVASPFLGKRSVNESDIAENRTVCRLSTEKSVISCEGVNFNFECGVVANLTVLDGVEHRGENFRMLPEGVEQFDRAESKEADVRRFEIVSVRGESSDLNDYTFVHGGQKVVLSLYWSEDEHDLGFRFREQQCWRTYVDMLRGLGPRNVKLVLDVARN